MKKITKILSISLVALVIVAIVVTACILTLPNANENVSNQTEVVNQNSELLDETTNEESTTYEPSGIYVFDKNSYSFSDVSKENSDEVLSYFNTKDFNGVYNTVDKLGFSDFVENLTATVSLGITNGDVDVSASNKTCSGTPAFLIENGYVYMVYVSENSYYVDKSSACPCTFSNGTIALSGSTADYVLEFSYSEDGSNLDYKIKFSYTDQTSGETIITPLAITTTLSKIENSEKILSSTSSQYIYNSNSTYILSSSTTTLNYLEKVAEMFGIENDEDVMSNVINILSGWSLSIADDYSKIFVQFSDTSISIVLNQNGVYTIDDVSFAIALHTVNFTSEDDVLSMIITVDENTTLTFEFIAK